ncbi:MAG: metal-dependent transcriptional regulator [Firmicutes bacterium]|nr:metal-dependent transcriptional regulator [Bacillota bacterium]
MGGGTAPAADGDRLGTPGAEAYLEAIYVLTVESRRVTSARVAEYLGVTPVSVSRALGRLERAGALAARTPDVRLTAAGWRRAAAVVRRHRLAERWLADRLGLDLVTAHLEAERIEHALSPRVEEALWQDLGRPATCPHGNPIPDAEGNVPPLAAAVPLAAVGPGAYVVDRIFEQIEGLRPLLAFVQEAGLVPGARVEVIAPGPPVAVRAPGGAAEVPVRVAECLLVRPA